MATLWLDQALCLHDDWFPAFSHDYIHSDFWLMFFTALKKKVSKRPFWISSSCFCQRLTLQVHNGLKSPKIGDFQFTLSNTLALIFWSLISVFSSWWYFTDEDFVLALIMEFSAIFSWWSSWFFTDWKISISWCLPSSQVLKQPMHQKNGALLCCCLNHHLAENRSFS